MVSASYQGMGIYDHHCKGSLILKYHDEYGHVCSICRKELVLEKHWYCSKWKETGRIREKDNQ